MTSRKGEPAVSDPATLLPPKEPEDAVGSPLRKVKRGDSSQESRQDRFG